VNVLVLGGNGFIGSHVIDELRDANHEVRVFGRDPDPWRPPLDGVRYYSGDFSNTLMLAEAMQGVDAVVHLISTTVPNTSNLDPVSDIQTNLVNTVQLLQLMKAAGVHRIIYFSSGGTVYGVPTLLPVPETNPLNPICSYGVVKVAIEKYLAMFEHLYGLRPLILRPSNPYGPRQGHQGVQGVVSTFMHRIVDGERLTIWGDGTVKRDYIYVGDLARLCRIVIESDQTGIFNAGSGEGQTLNEVVAAIEAVTGRIARTDHTAPRRFDVPEIVLDISKATDVFHWKPQVGFDEGLARYYAWLCQ
jgi:UDP-glucose 4-epimerase